MKQTKRIIMTLTLLIAAVFFMNSANLPAGNVQAASASSMKKAYKKYLTKSVSGKKYYKVVNIGDRNKPVLLIGTYKGFGKGTYTGCNVYYYKSGKVRKVGSLSDGRDIALYTKKGQNYINSGLSDEALYFCVKDGKSYFAHITTATIGKSTRMINTKNVSLKKVEKSLKIMAIWIPDSIIQQKTAIAIKVQ